MLFSQQCCRQTTKCSLIPLTYVKEEKCASSTLPGNETSLWFAICLLMVHHLLRSHCGERTLLHPSASKSQLMSFSSETSSSAILAGHRKHGAVRKGPPGRQGCRTRPAVSHVTAQNDMLVTSPPELRNRHRLPRLHAARGQAES